MVVAPTTCRESDFGCTCQHCVTGECCYVHKMPLVLAHVHVCMCHGAITPPVGLWQGCHVVGSKDARCAQAATGRRVCGRSLAIEVIFVCGPSHCTTCASALGRRLCGCHAYRLDVTDLVERFPCCNIGQNSWKSWRKHVDGCRIRATVARPIVQQVTSNGYYH